MPIVALHTTTTFRAAPADRAQQLGREAPQAMWRKKFLSQAR